MLSSQPQSDTRQRRIRPVRRIKRITHRYLLFLDLSPIQSLNTSFRNINGLVAEQQNQPNMTFVQLPLQLLIFDQNNLETLTQLLNNDIGTMPMTRNDINQLPALTSKIPKLKIESSRKILSQYPRDIFNSHANLS